MGVIPCCYDKGQEKIENVNVILENEDDGTESLCHNEIRKESWSLNKEKCSKNVHLLSLKDPFPISLLTRMTENDSFQSLSKTLDINKSVTLLSFKKMNQSSKEIVIHSPGLQIYKLTTKDRALLTSVFTSYFPSYDSVELESIFVELCYHEYEKNIVIMDNSSDRFNILKNGNVGIYFKNALIETFTNGQTFGNLSYLTKQSRKHNYVSITKCSVFSICTAKLKQLMNGIIGKKYELFLEVINMLPMIQIENEVTKKSLSEELIKINLSKGYDIQKANEDCNSIIYVASGEITENGYFKHTSSLINIELLFDPQYKCKSGLNVTENSCLIILSKDTLISFYGQSYNQALIFKAFENSIVQNVEIYKHLREIVESMNQDKYCHQSFEKEDKVRKRNGLKSFSENKFKLELISIDDKSSSKPTHSKRLSEQMESENLNYKIKCFTKTATRVAAVTKTIDIEKLYICFTKKLLRKYSWVTISKKSFLLVLCGNLNEEITKESVPHYKVIYNER